MADNITSKTSFVDQYLKRLQYSGPVLPNLQTLQQLHHRHMLTIPFENLSNIQNEEYANTKDELFEKIIQGRRGGICYELNSLFAFLLRDLGFDVTIAGVFYEIMKTFQLPRCNHQITIVNLEGEQWLADVTSYFTRPLRLAVDEIQDGGNSVYRLKIELDEDGIEHFVLQSQNTNEIGLALGTRRINKNSSECSEWSCTYKFTTDPCSLSDFNENKSFYLKDPDSPFNKGLICSALRPWGRMTLTGSGKLIRTYIENKKVVQRDVEVLQNQEDVWLTLEKEFGVKNNR